MAIFTQENRHITITTPLGANKLLLSSLQGSEGISRLFNFDLSLFSEDQGIAFADIIGKGVTISIELPSGQYRYFNGIISTFSQVSGEGKSSDDSTRGSLYRATLVPKLWFLTRSAELRIFQNMNVPDIVNKVLDEFGITDKEIKLQKSYEKREYCVQYRETHFNFISRLLEEEGIFYYFEHKADKHRLVIADSSQASVDCPGQGTASYQIEGTAPEDDTISFIEKIQMIQPGKYMLSDFNFETPGNSLNVNIPGKYNLGPGDREIYDYPGGYNAKGSGDQFVRVRMEEEEAQITTVRGVSGCRSFTAGYRFKLLNSDRKDMNDKEFILTAVAHTMTHSVQRGGEFNYSNRFSCIPADVPFRPPRVTPKPVVQGAQTAIVVGKSGEEIWTDKHGRVKVQFHWDREGKGDENSSCWIRVSQLWAGTGWGAMFIPRIGQEVIVDFLEGDPDCPIITGRVYHGTNTPPYTLPAEQTKSTIKSYSSKGGGGFNEFRFEDKKGEEQLFMHAEKQMDVRVKKDSLEWIGNERHLIVVKDQLEKVDGDKHLTVTGDQNEKVDGTVSLKIGTDLQQKIGANHALDAGQEIHLKAGMKVIIEAGTQISLKAGGSHIDIGPSGVSIKGSIVNVIGDGSVFVKGAMVMLNSGGSASPAGSGSGASPDVPKAPKEADKAEPGKATTVNKPTPTARPAPPAASSSPPGPQATALHQAAQSGAPFCDT